MYLPILEVCFFLTLIEQKLLLIIFEHRVCDYNVSDIPNLQDFNEVFYIDKMHN